MSAEDDLEEAINMLNESQMTQIAKREEGEDAALAEELLKLDGELKEARQFEALALERVDFLDKKLAAQSETIFEHDEQVLTLNSTIDEKNCVILKLEKLLMENKQILERNAIEIKRMKNENFGLGQEKNRLENALTTQVQQNNMIREQLR